MKLDIRKIPTPISNNKMPRGCKTRGYAPIRHFKRMQIYIKI